MLIAAVNAQAGLLATSATFRPTHSQDRFSSLICLRPVINASKGVDRKYGLLCETGDSWRDGKGVSEVCATFATGEEDRRRLKNLRKTGTEEGTCFGAKRDFEP